MQVDTIGNRLAGVGVSTGGTAPNTDYQPISSGHMGNPSGQQQYNGISGLPNTSQGQQPMPNFRAQQVDNREQQKQQMANQYWSEQQQQPQMSQMGQQQQPGGIQQQIEYMQPQQPQPPMQGYQTTRTLGGIDGRDQQNQSIAEARFNQDTFIPRAREDCHNPVNMEHIYRRSLFLEGAPVPEDMRLHVTPKQWEQHQAMLNQHQTKNSYRDQANDRLARLSPISCSLAPPVGPNAKGSSNMVGVGPIGG